MEAIRSLTDKKQIKITVYKTWIKKESIIK